MLITTQPYLIDLVLSNGVLTGSPTRHDILRPSLRGLERRAAHDLKMWSEPSDIAAAADCLTSDVHFNAIYQLTLADFCEMVAVNRVQPSLLSPAHVTAGHIERQLLSIWGGDHVDAVRRVVQLLILHQKYAPLDSPDKIAELFKERRASIYDIMLHPRLAEALVNSTLVDVYYLAALGAVWGPEVMQMQLDPATSLESIILKTTEPDSGWMRILLEGVECGLKDALRLLALPGDQDAEPVDLIQALEKAGIKPLDQHLWMPHRDRMRRALTWIKTKEREVDLLAPFDRVSHGD